MGLRTRPTRRTKEAATAYLHRIGRKLIQGHKNGRMEDDEDYEVEEDEDDEEDDDDDDDDEEKDRQVVSVSGITTTKAQDKTSELQILYEGLSLLSLPVYLW